MDYSIKEERKDKKNQQRFVYVFPLHVYFLKLDVIADIDGFARTVLGVQTNHLLF